VHAEGVAAPFDRALRGSPVVVAGTVMGIRESGEVRLHVSMVLKGDGKLAIGSDIIIDVSTAPAGVWPSLGMKVIMGLKTGVKDTYSLNSRFGCVLPAESSVVKAVADLVGAAQETKGDITPLPGGESTPVVVPLPADSTELGPKEPVRAAVVQVTSSIESQVLAAELIAIGRVVEVAFSDQSGERAVLKFIIETRLLGGGVPDLVEVHVPAPDRNFTGELPAFRTGRYCLFLKSRMSGGGLDLVSPYYGTYFIENDTQEAMLKEKIFATPTMRERKQNAPILTTIQATTGVWQDAWNGKNLARLIACYSKKSVFRQLYDAGGKHRMALDRKLTEFPGTVEIRITRVQFPNELTAEANVELILEVEGATERRTAVMKFVKESGEWLIMEEGF